MKRSLLVGGALLFAFMVSAQKPASGWLKKRENLGIKTSVGLQLWSSYTLGQEIFEEGKYEPVDDRLNFQIRRSRLSVKGQPYDQLKFNVTAAFDLIGRDLLAGTEAGINNGSSPIFRLWNAYVQWQLLAGSEKLNLMIGYQVLQIGRESITSAMRSNSMEKAWSQNYLRRHLTGIGPGRAPGLNLGGLFWEEGQAVSWGYDVGIFTPVYEGFSGNSVGREFSPLFTGRLELYFGDPESEKYTIGHKINYFGKRKGVTLAFSGARQGHTDLFASNTALSTDLLFNWNHLTIDGDWSLMWREGTDFTVVSQTGYGRLAYNVNLSNGYVLEPVVMVVQYLGPTNAQAQANAQLVNTQSGTEQILDVGLNFYFNPDLKLSLHYTARDANAGEAGNGAIVNNYFYQGGVGPIHRGDWLGLGLVAVF